jgi:hypothetical protein
MSNDKQSVAILFFVHDLEKEFNREDKRILENLKLALDDVEKNYGNHRYVVRFVDDGSWDNTMEILEKWKMDNQDRWNTIKIETGGDLINLGLVKRTKYTYREILKDGAFNYIIKTDIDGDFNLNEVLNYLISCVGSLDNVIAIRGLEKRAEYEEKRRREIVEILQSKEKALKLEGLNINDLDPSSVGSQLYKSSMLSEILGHPMVEEYNRKWGLDFLIPLVAALMKYKLEIKKISGSRDPERRKLSKVRNQFDTYIEIIASFLREKPEDVSEYYNKDNLL